jgi:hypothetical protein
MGCVFVIIALAVPRVLMFIAFLVTDWFGRAFETQAWPILGFVFLPYATLAYIAAMLNNNHSLTGGWLVLFIVAILVDLTHLGHGGRTYRRESRSGRA